MPPASRFVRPQDDDDDDNDDNSDSGDDTGSNTGWTNPNTGERIVY